MYTNEKLKAQLHSGWQQLMEKVMVVNRDVGDRFFNENLAFDLDPEQDRLRMIIGGRQGPTYTQGSGHVCFDLGVDDDRIQAITIQDVTAFMSERDDDRVWTSLLDLLREVRRVELPPVSPGAERAAFARHLWQLLIAPSPP
ncbi:MAG: hypothetical protein WD359_04710 [Dehalococcoidia bacterium]